MKKRKPVQEYDEPDVPMAPDEPEVPTAPNPKKKRKGGSVNVDDATMALSGGKGVY